jgi:polysaccharide export outer membrane protein
MVGAVKHEGIIELKYPMTVLQAISEAGGLTDFAKKKKISILRMVNGKEFRFAFNYDAVIKGQQVEQNILVVPDDTIVVLR